MTLVVELIQGVSIGNESGFLQRQTKGHAKL
mgnify:CR=1 FL=1